MFALLLSLLIQSTFASKKDLYQALDKIDKNQLSEALKHLGEISKNSPYFHEAFVLAQKIHYRQKSWDRLFAGFYFYKAHFFINSALDPSYLRPDILILEAIALGKLCRYKEALIQILKLKKWHQQRGIIIPDAIYEAEAFLVASIKVNGYEQINNETFDLVAPMTKDAYWKLRDKQILKLKSPHHLRMNIKSQCKK